MSDPFGASGPAQSPPMGTVPSSEEAGRFGPEVGGSTPPPGMPEPQGTGLVEMPAGMMPQPVTIPDTSPAGGTLMPSAQMTEPISPQVGEMPKGQES